mmetsp:Transcript_6778/g.18708  ORF Transcript_6778/g.18708 Transcript_6778/m.18708 type:complete len:511 (-) Transcript_6778:68-1600(-)
MTGPLAERTKVFIFVNPTAGGNRAATYLNDVGTHHLNFAEAGVFADLWIYNIREGDSGKKEGFLQVKRLSNACNGASDLIRILVAGGDGTVMWTLTELTKTQVDMTKVAVGHIPFGTANDFSRTTGWGPTAPVDLVGDNKEHLLRDMKRWVNAEVRNFDVWEIDICTAPEGTFYFVHDGKKALTENDKVQHGLVELPEGGMRMRKPMVNYFSFGSIERAGIGFEKMRTRSRLCNILRYGWEGTKKWLFRRPPDVSDVLEEICIGVDSSIPATGSTASAASTLPKMQYKLTVGEAVAADDIKLESEDAAEEKAAAMATPPQPELPETPPWHPDGREVSCLTCASRMTTITLNTKVSGSPHFHRRSANLLFINIPSFAGGANPWAWSKKVAVVGCESASDELLRCQQDMGDGKLELMSYQSGLHIGLDAVSSKARVPGRGGGRRIASDPGPFVAQFKPPSAAKYKSADGRVYFQIDGEFFITTKPKTAVVRHLQAVRVLFNDEPLGVARGCI